MSDTLQLEEFQAHLHAEDRSPVTVAGYLGDVHLFARWYADHYAEPLTPEGFTNDSIRGYKQHLLEQSARPPKRPFRRTPPAWSSVNRE